MFLNYTGRSRARSVIMLAASLAACGHIADITAGIPLVHPESITFDTPLVTLEVGDQTTLHITTAGMPPGAAASWLSNQPSIATVSPTTGQITALAPGQASISVQIDTAHASALVTVIPAHVQTLTVDTIASNLAVADSVQLTATARNSHGTVLVGRNVTWSSDSPTLVAVSPSGLLVGILPGTAQVRATIDSVSATRLVVIQPAVASKITIAGTTTVQQTDTAQLQAQVRDRHNNVLDQPITWTSSAPAIATVSPTGVVVAFLTIGSTTITATSGPLSGSTTFTVQRSGVRTVRIVGPTSMRFETTLPFSVMTFDAAGFPIAADPPQWRSSDDTVLSMTPDGQATAVALGTVTVFVTVGGVTASTRVTVNP